jgi:lycopene cyclase domain-containing protein
MNPTYTYLFINLLSILVPLFFSFEKKRIAFYRSWPALFPAMIITGAFFIAWDHWLTVWGAWQFNPVYVMGIYWWGLPVEEWMFFFTIPYACLFTYESLNFLLKGDPFRRSWRNISIVLVVILSLTAFLNAEKLYTGIKLSLTACMLVFAAWRNFPFMGRFFRSYLVCLIPFLVVNGILTALPVVIYNDQENLGIRIFTIPVEDTMYMMLLLLMNTVLFEYFRSKRPVPQTN